MNRLLMFINVKIVKAVLQGIMHKIWIRKNDSAEWKLDFPENNMILSSLQEWWKPKEKNNNQKTEKSHILTKNAVLFEVLYNF